MGEMYDIYLEQFLYQANFSAEKAFLKLIRIQNNCQIS